MQYSETEQKWILREMEDELLALVAVDRRTEAFEVIYSDGTYRDYENRHHGTHFYEAWKRCGLQQVFAPERERIRQVISRENVERRFAEADSFTVVTRFVVQGEPAYCRIRLSRDVIEPGVFVLSIRSLDRDIRTEMERLTQLSELHRRGTIYREAILANAAGYMEVDLTEDRILTTIYNDSKKWDTDEYLASKPEKPDSFDAFGSWRAAHTVTSDPAEFLAFGCCAHLIACFRAGQRIVSQEYRSYNGVGYEKVCKETYYLSPDSATGHLRAIGVLYNLTRQQKQAEDMRRLEETLKQMRMKNFISQMHPHFLYNALSSIREIVLTDPEYGAELLYDFTTHLRASIRAMTNDNRIPFSQELENIKAYVSIETMRFGDRLRVDYDIRTADFEILPLSIQPLVENAIKHGLYEKRGPGRVLVAAEEADDAWVVRVEDDGVGFDPAAVRQETEAGERDSTGLHNLIFRLENMLQARIGIDSRPGEGTRVTVRIPKDVPGR